MSWWKWYKGGGPKTISSSKFTHELTRKMSQDQWISLYVAVKCDNCGQITYQRVAGHPSGGMPTLGCASCGTVWFAERKPLWQ